LQVYERRKLAALEVEQLVQKMASHHNTERIYSIVDTLSEFYATPAAQSNARKGALLCLAAVAVGLAGSGSAEAQSEAFLSRVFPPILTACTDQDSRVRYYSLEALYNLVKSTRPAILSRFVQVFDILFRLCSDTDPNVQNATSFLSDLLKDCVAQSPDFDLPSFLPVLVECMEVESAAKRLFLLGWISLLDSLAHADRQLHKAFPQLIPKLISFLEDEALEVRHAAQKLLEELSRDIANDPTRTNVGELAAVLADRVLKSYNIYQQKENVHRDGAQTASLQLLNQLVDVALPKQLAPILPSVLRACLASIDTQDTTMKSLALDLNTNLMIKTCEMEGAEPPALLDAATEGVGALQETAKLESLKWTALLLQQHASADLKIEPNVMRALCDALSSTSDRVVQEAAGVLGALSAAHKKGFDEALASIVDSFRGASGSLLLQRRGIIIIERLCTELGARRVLMTLSTALASERDSEFARLMAQALNVLLLTSPGLQEARDLIISKDSDACETPFFSSLFHCFSASSAAALSLALLAQAYSLACDILAALAEPPLIQGMSATVVELGQLVSLIEAPAFAALRLQLLDAHAQRPDLLRTLYSLLMLLPQGDAFRMLQQRLSCVPRSLVVRTWGDGEETKEACVPAMLQTFIEVQSRRAAASPTS